MSCHASLHGFLRVPAVLITKSLVLTLLTYKCDHHQCIDS